MDDLTMKENHMLACGYLANIQVSKLLWNEEHNNRNAMHNATLSILPIVSSVLIPVITLYNLNKLWHFFWVLLRPVTEEFL